MTHYRLTLLAAATLAALTGSHLGAQSRTWRVGATPGAHFAQIQPAVDAAAPGDTILVDPGTYGLVTVSKGVRLLGDRTFVQTTGPSPDLIVSNLPANETLVVRGFGARAGHSGINAQFVVEDCRGAVVFENCLLDYCISVRRSDRVSFESVALQYGVFECEDSNVSLHGCAATGSSAFIFNYALDCLRSDVIATDCQLVGGAYSILGQGPFAAIDLEGGSLVLAGSGSRVLAGLGPHATPAVQATSGALTIDPVVSLVPNGSAPPVGGGVAAHFRPLATVAARVDQGILTMVLDAPGTQIGVIFAGLPFGTPAPTPFGMTMWANPAATPFAFGVTPDAQGIGVHAVSVAGVPPGIPLVFQGAVLRHGPIELATPVTRTLD